MDMGSHCACRHSDKQGALVQVGRTEVGLPPEMRNQSEVMHMAAMRCRGVGSDGGLSPATPGQQRQYSVSRSSVKGFISASRLAQ